MRTWFVMAVVAAALAAAGAKAEESPLQKAITKNPERFVERAVDLIAGFSGSDGLRAAGIEEHVALERAAARASMMRRFLAMDLDADGAVDRAELAASQRAANAAGRGRLERQFVAADADENGRIDAAEIAAAGQSAAVRALSEDEAGLLRGLLTLDGDGDGALTADEVRAAVERLGEPA